MTSRDTYNTSCSNADKTLVASGVTHTNAEATTIDAQLSVVGYTTQSGTFSSLDSATKTANSLRLTNGLSRERARQATVAAARDTRRDTGDRSPF